MVFLIILKKNWKHGFFKLYIRARYTLKKKKDEVYSSYYRSGSQPMGGGVQLMMKFREHLLSKQLRQFFNL